MGRCSKRLRTQMLVCLQDSACMYMNYRHVGSIPTNTLTSDIMCFIRFLLGKKTKSVTTAAFVRAKLIGVVLGGLHYHAQNCASINRNWLLRMCEEVSRTSNLCL